MNRASSPRRRVGRALLAPLLALLLLPLLSACADTRITWRSGERHAPLPDDAPIALFVRSSAPADLRDVMLERGAQEVAAFPAGERVAEFASRSAPWIMFETTLDDVREGARLLGADTALATGSISGPTGEAVVYFQLLRSDDAPHDGPSDAPGSGSGSDSAPR